jgi:hypothetical protein
MVAFVPQQHRSAEVGRIQRSLHAVAETARGIDTRTFEVDARARVRDELAPTVRGVMDDTDAVLGDVLARYDQPPEAAAADSSGMFNRVFDDMVVEAPSDPRQRIADISFVARWELARKRVAVVEAERRGDDWTLIAECCSARRRVVKAASGVERVLAEVEALPSLFAGLYQTERQRAIETRAAYYAFVIGVRSAELQWQSRDLERCLRLIGTGIARLVGRSIYEELRIEDRRSLRSLQARLFTWLRGTSEPREGLRLISEISAFGSLLMEVNRRPSLIEHDREVLGKLLAALTQPATDKQALFRTLVTIRGRDPELDHLIDAQADLRPDLWHDLAETLLARLREQGEGA